MSQTLSLPKGSRPVKTPKPYVKFASKGENSFYDTVKEQVAEYFRENNISQYGNRKMYIKTASMLSFYLVPFAVMLTGVAANNMVLNYFLWFVMSIGLVGIGTSVMHDSYHGAYSRNKKVNKFFASLIHIIGGYGLNWKIQHNILHHTYTNLHGLDEDIDAGALLRMSPYSKRLPIHRFQHLYALFVYSLMNVYWATAKDYRGVIKYNEAGLLQKERKSFARALTEVTLTKLAYFAVFIGLPLIFSGIPVLHVILGYVFMQMCSGLALALIFQPAHVMETSEFVAAEAGAKLENSWAVHQILNTTNFCPKSNITSWFIGGLNYQIEHHLFPQVCHVHYPKISGIVERVARQYDLPYLSQPTFLAALNEHFKMLKVLGKRDSLQLTRLEEKAA